MEKHYYVIKFGTVNPHGADKKKSSTLRNALAHNRRTTQQALGATTNIDLRRSHLNYTIKGNADTRIILEWWKAQREAVVHSTGKPIRVNAPHAIEVIMSLPARWAGEQAAFFNDCVAYAENEFGANNLISADVHLDETYRHCHILFIPIVERQDGRHWLSPLGNAKAIYDRRERFYKAVGAMHELKPSPKLKRNERTALYHAVIQDMELRNNPAIKSQNWSVIKTQIASDPMPHCEALGIDIEAYLAPTAKRAQEDCNNVDALVKLMISPRPEKKASRKTPIRGFPENPLTYPPVIGASPSNPYPSVRGSISTFHVQCAANDKVATTNSMQDNFKCLLNLTARQWGLTSRDKVIYDKPALNANVAESNGETWYDREADHNPSDWNEVIGENVPFTKLRKNTQKEAATLLVSEGLEHLKKARNQRLFKSAA